MTTGSFLVEEIGDLKAYGPFLSGTITAGSLKPGMEAKAEVLLIVIVEIMDQEDGIEILQKAHKGQKVMIRPSGATLDQLRGLAGQTLQFTDGKSVPLRGKFFLKPNLT